MIQNLEFHAMGSRMQAMLDHPASDPPGDLESVPVWFEEWEQALSRFRSESELCQLNIHAGEKVQVSQILWDVYQEALSAERLTGGLVTPLILDALMYAGYDRSFDALFDLGSRLLPDGGISEILLEDIQTEAETRSVSVPLGARPILAASPKAGQLIRRRKG